GESGTLHLAAILDLFSRCVVGWAVSAVNDRHLTLAALTVALNRRCPETGLLHHSDRGSTYASDDYQDRLTVHGITCSMSRTGDCLRQRADGGVLFDTEDRARRPLRQPWRGQARAVRLHRRVLQHAAPPFDARLRQSGRIRATLLVRQERAMRVMVEIGATASIRKPRRMPRNDSEEPGMEAL